MTDLLERARNRIHDAPLKTEYLIDELIAEILRLRDELGVALGILTEGHDNTAIGKTEPDNARD